MSELTAQGDYGPLSVEDCASWLDRKYSRHGEIEDKGCAELLRALKAENARLSEVAAAEMKLREGNFDTITQLEAENAQLRRDAERYRWICRFPEDADYEVTHALNGCSRPGSVDGPSFRDLLSDAIDAALSAVPSDSPADVKSDEDVGR